MNMILYRVFLYTQHLHHKVIVHKGLQAWVRLLQIKKV